MTTAALASASLIAIASSWAAPAFAAQPAAPAAEAAPGGDTLTEIVVTARRENESVQSVPVSMQVVTGAAVQKLAITSPTEISKLTPGLTLRLDDPADPVIILRGVRWTQASGTPAIPIYLNEISFDPIQTLKSMYDIGQIEVLRGPQGTSRGAPSISGAVTITSARPVMNEFGGYLSALGGTHDHENVQGALNIPVITDKLAIRIAGFLDDSEGNGVHSLNDAIDPSLKNLSGRVSVRFEPTDNLQFNLMYQRQDTKYRQYTQVAGPGGVGVPALGIPANYNSPALSASDRLAVQDGEDFGHIKNNLVTLNSVWDVLGQQVSYNFGWQQTNGPNYTSLDPANALIGYNPQQVSRGPGTIYFNELRLSSAPGWNKYFDYALGYYSQRAKANLAFDTVGSLLPGSFGNPFAGSPSPFINLSAIDRYSLDAHSDISLTTKNYSFYGNLTLHLPYDFELSGGLRWIHDRRPTTIVTHTTDAFAAALQNPLAGALSCEQLAALSPAAAGLQTSPIYAGVCDFPVPGMNLPVDNFGKTYTPTIFNASLSRKFTPDILAYATVGSSWRAGLPAINNPGLPSDLVFPNPEKAKSYEVGFKSTFGKVRINADVFQINYTGQLTQFQFVPYFNSTSGSISQTSQAFFGNLNSKVRGVEAEIYTQPIEGLTLDANLSYAKIKSAGGQAPCSDPTRPVTALNPINFCAAESGDTLNAAPEFQASLNGGYVHPVGPVDGYLRFVVNYQGHNPNFGASDTPTDAYTLVDLYAGINSDQAGWDLGLYAKNVFDKKVQLVSTQIITGFGADTTFGANGLSRVVTTLPREVGVQARYAFGSH